jgi:hypothetical protein
MSRRCALIDGEVGRRADACGAAEGQAALIDSVYTVALVRIYFGERSAHGRVA